MSLIKLKEKYRNIEYLIVEEDGTN